MDEEHYEGRPLVLQCPYCRTGFDVEGNREYIYEHEDEGLYGKTFLMLDEFECEDCKRVYTIKFELVSIERDEEHEDKEEVE